MVTTYENPYKNRYHFDQYSSAEGGTYSVAPYAYSMLFHKIKLELAKVFNYDVSKVGKFRFDNILELISQSQYGGYVYDYNIEASLELVSNFFFSIPRICNNIFRMTSVEYDNYLIAEEEAHVYFSEQLEDCSEVSIDYTVTFDSRFDSAKILALANEFDKNSSRKLGLSLDSKNRCTMTLEIVIEPLYYVDIDIARFMYFIIFLHGRGVFEVESNN